MKEPIRWSVIVLAVTGWRCCLEDQKPQPPKPPSPELGLFFWAASVLAGFRGNAACSNDPAVYELMAQYSSANMMVITRSVTDGSVGSGEWYVRFLS